MKTVDFVVIGSSGGGGTISWLLAKAGFDVVVLEAGSDWAQPLDDESLQFNPTSHDEYRYRLERPERKRRLRGDYNTFRKPDQPVATPFGAGWTGTMLGGGSVIWGAWSFRALPIDFALATHFRETGMMDKLQSWEYSVPDWNVPYREMEPFYNVAETLLSVSGDREAVNRAVHDSPWYQEFKDRPYFAAAGNWQPGFSFTSPP